MSAICLAYDMSHRGQKIEKRLQQLGRSARWLAKEVGVAPQTVLNWIDGARPQKDEIWEKLAQALEVDKSVLLDEAKKLPSEIGSTLYPIPSGEIEMPKWPSLPASENWDIDPSECTEFIPVPSFLARKTPRDPERVAAQVAGMSMSPRLVSGDLVVIELVKVPRTGRLVLARSETGRTIKVLKRVHAGFELHSINPDHGQARADEWEIEGYVVAIIRDYETGRGVIEWDDAGLGP
jgi:SOS-response transcriptional repressor LexA